MGYLDTIDRCSGGGAVCSYSCRYTIHFPCVLARTPTPLPSSINTPSQVVIVSTETPTNDINTQLPGSQTVISTQILTTPTNNLEATINAEITATEGLYLTATPYSEAFALQLAESFSGSRNTDWTPFAHDFSDGVTMMLVPVGSFRMGEGTTEYQQQMDEPFWIDRTEVTRAQYQRCVDADVCEATPASEVSTEPDQPINRVMWVQAFNYCHWRGARLPKEHEWEYAARGVESWKYPWGDIWNPNNAVHSLNSGGRTAAVDSLPAGESWVGANDMSGNVWEWVNSLYESYPYRPSDGRENIINRTDNRVIRGGSYDDAPEYVRASDRAPNDPLTPGGYYLVGFRCARS